MSQQQVERFARGVEIARQTGMDVRFANLQGHGGGWCEAGERSFLFVDISQDVLEQLDHLEDAIQMIVDEWKQSQKLSAAEALKSLESWLAGRTCDGANDQNGR